ncbi:MAG: TetR/AcrR family transcriptional regulator [Ilumatobacter sp.]|nr:TetR/AcrR family transcriptional regulator [Ilumatobacter sp.]
MPTDDSTIDSVDDAPTDGRRARRERSRAAVIDAVFDVVNDGKVPPTVEDVAARAGVSVSSIFRNFDGLPDMQRQAFDTFQHRYRHLLQVTVDPHDPRADRISELVKARIELYVAAGPLMHIARQRALDYQPMADGVGRMRSRLADQTRHAFEPEVRALTPAGAANLVALLDATTSPEAFEVMGATHGRTSRQIARTWSAAIAALLADRTPTTEEPR